MSKPKHKFIIRYKSGTAIAVRADKLSVAVSRMSGQKTEIQWQNMQPRPMEIGDLSDIESIWQVK